jgi:uncharacterized DUF497 family protein
MDSRPPVWDAWNRDHIEGDHAERRIRCEEVAQTMNDPERREVLDERADGVYHAVLGQTEVGRLLVIVWVDHKDGRYPVHAHQAGRREARKYYE